MLPLLFRALRVVLLACGTLTVSFAATLRVNGPQESIQGVIGNATNGDIVIVTSGVYTQTFNLGGKSIKVMSESGPSTTIIVAPPSSPPNPIFAIGFSVENRSAELRGFTIANSVGGIILQATASPTLVGNVITNCDEGMVCFGSPLVSSNMFVGSKVNGVRLVDLPNAVFEHNLFERNKTGVIANTGGGTIFRRNIFRGHTDPAVGIHFGSVDFIQNIVIDNDSHGFIGVVGVNQRGHWLLHNLFLNNGRVAGAGVYLSGSYAQSLVANNIIVGNYGVVCYNGNGPLPTVRNNNVVSPNPYSELLPNLTGQFGNISAAPQFLNAALADYRLLAISPEVDRGNATDTVEFDYSGGPRNVDGNGDGESLPDIGPFEYAPGPPRPSTTLTASSGQTTVALTWTPFDLATSYQVTRAVLPEGPFEVLGNGSLPNFADENVVAKAIYYYAVAGINERGVGAPSQAIRVRAANGAPVAAPDTVETDEERAVSFDFLANDSDSDGDSLSFELLQLPANGVTTLTGSTTRYAPKLNYNGSEQLIYRLSDGYSGVSTGIVEIVVRPLNDPPTVHLEQARVPSGTWTDIPITVNDPDNTVFIYSVTRNPSSGVVDLGPDGSRISYRSRHLFTGLDSLRFRVSDGTATTTDLTLSIRITAPTDADRDGMADAWENDFDLNNPASDPDGDGLSNAAEYLLGTSPVDRESVLKLLSIAPDSSGVRISWKSIGGVRYRIFKSSVFEAGAFVETPRLLVDEIDPAPYGQANTNTFFDSASSTGFYLIRAIP